MKLRIFLVISFIFTGFSLLAQNAVGPVVKRFISDSMLKGASIGIYAVDLESGKSLISENSRLMLVPASTLKLVTSAAAIEMLGPGYRFRTDLGYSGQIDSLSGTLKGDLVIKGGGDPALGSSWLDESPDSLTFYGKWMADLKKAGVEKIDGNLVSDLSAYEENTLPGSWAWEDIGNYYGAPPSALSAFDNMIRLHFDTPEKPGETVPLEQTDPPEVGITWQNELKSSAGNHDMANIYGSPWGEKRLITGTIPAGRKKFEMKASLPDPPSVLGKFLRTKLSDAGINISGEVKVTNVAVPVTLVSSYYSPPLSDICKIMNHESVNLFADHLVFQLALEKSGKGNLETGLKLIHSFWKENGIRDTFYIEDGSGLSRIDGISAEQLTDILVFMNNGIHRDVFKSSLPGAGTGTLSSFRTTEFPGRTLICKSGSMTRVRNYAGYLKCDSGREIAFAILVNNFPGTQTEVIGKIQQLLLNFKRSF